MQKIEAEQQERLIDLQSLHMRDNLIFYYIHDESEESGDACAEKLVCLFEQNLRIENAREIRLDRVHRLGRYGATKHRPIIAKFCYYQDREKIRKSARNLDGSQYSISQQFPKEILARRKELIPTLKRLKEEGKRAYISVDKLYVDGRLYKGALEQPGQQQQNNRGNFARGRGRGLSQGRDQGQGHGFGPGQANAQGGGNDRGQAEENMYNVLQDEGRDEGQGQMEAEGGQSQGEN